MTYFKLIALTAMLGMVGCTGFDMGTNVQVSVSSKKSRKPKPSKPVLPIKAAHESVAVSNSASPEIAHSASTTQITPSPNVGLSQEAALALADSYHCSVCHKTESKLLGPAWKAIAHKYQTDADAVNKISINIKRGGNFGWNRGIMPAKGGSNISDADIIVLAEFIISLK